MLSRGIDDTVWVHAEQGNTYVSTSICLAIHMQYREAHIIFHLSERFSFFVLDLNRIFNYSLF